MKTARRRGKAVPRVRPRLVETPSAPGIVRASVTKLTSEPCPLCLELAKNRRIRIETVQRVPQGVSAPRDLNGNPCCFDCASAHTLMKLKIGLDFEMARIAVGNDRQEQYRLPGALLGTVAMGCTRPSAPGDLEDQHRWLDKHKWFDIDEES